MKKRNKIRRAYASYSDALQLISYKVHEACMMEKHPQVNVYHPTSQSEGHPTLKMKDLMGKKMRSEKKQSTSSLYLPGKTFGNINSLLS